MLNAPAPFIPNDLTPVFERRNDVMQKISDLQKELKVINNSLVQQFEDQARNKARSQDCDRGQVRGGQDQSCPHIKHRHNIVHGLGGR